MELILQAIKALFRKLELSRTHYDDREEYLILSSTDENVNYDELIKISDEVMTEDRLIDSRVEVSLSIPSESINFDNTIFVYDGCEEGPSESFAIYSYYNDDLGKNIYLLVFSVDQADGTTSGTYLAVWVSGIGTYSMKLYGQVGELKTLDPKYIPDSIYEGISEAQATANSAYNTANSAYNTTNNKMNKTNPTGTGSFSLNRRANTIVGSSSFAEGYDTAASGEYSHAEGISTIASGQSSHAEGSSTIADGKSSHAEGNWTRATSADYSISTTSEWTKGFCTHAEGYGTVAYGRCSHAEGNGTKASGNDSHAEGSSNKASGQSSHAEGNSNKASGRCSHAEGGSTTASGDSSHAEGVNTTASGSYSHAEGVNTTASGDSSHAEGVNTIASGDSSHAEGNNTKASSNYQHAQGKYNIEDTSNTYAHIVGNGTSDTARSNAHTLDWNGNSWYQGDVYVGGTNQTTGSKKLATEEYVDGLVPDLSGYATKDEIPVIPDLSNYATKEEIPVVPSALPNPNALTFKGAVNAVYDGSQAVSVEIPSGGGGTDISLGLTSASVGQTIKVKAVDESGKPTEWEAADVESGGGGGEWKVIKDLIISENVDRVDINTDDNGNAFSLHEIQVFTYTESYETTQSIFTFLMNGYWSSTDPYFYSGFKSPSINDNYFKGNHFVALMQDGIADVFQPWAPYILSSNKGGDIFSVGEKYQRIESVSFVGKFLAGSRFILFGRL